MAVAAPQMTVCMPLCRVLHSPADQREDALATKELQTLRWVCIGGDGAPTRGAPPRAR
jgi:hypothetical protein